MTDLKSHPDHYGGEKSVYEVIKVLEAWLSPEQFIGFLRGNAIKYLPRAGKKGPAEDDLFKSADYSGIEIEFRKRINYADPLAAAQRLAESIHKKHFSDQPGGSGWKALPDLMGVLSQIDNMTSALVRRASPLPGWEPTKVSSPPPFSPLPMAGKKPGEEG
jgi:hypothetical protein